MSSWLDKLAPAGSFARGVAVLTGGTAAAQGLVVLALPLLTRLYSPEDFQLLAVYAAAIAIITTVSCLRYNIAIPLPNSDRDGLAVLVVALIPAGGISALLGVLVILEPGLMADMLGQPNFEPYLWMVPLGVLLASSYNALQYWASRKRRFGLIARTRMARSCGGVGAQVALGAVSASPFGLVFGQLLLNGLGAMSLMKSIWSKDRDALKTLGWRRVWRQARRYHQFPLWSVPEALFNTASMQLPLLLLAAFAVGPEAGFLFLSMRVMGLPMALMGASVSQVFLAEAPKRLGDGTLHDFTRRTMLKLTKVGALPLLAVACLAPIFFPLVFGAEWERAGWLMVWMAPWFILQFIASPVSMVLHVLGRQRLAASLQGLGLVIRVGVVGGCLWLAAPYVSEAYALSGAVFYGVYLAVIISLVKFGDGTESNEKT